MKGSTHGFDRFSFLSLRVATTSTRQSLGRARPRLEPRRWHIECVCRTAVWRSWLARGPPGSSRRPLWRIQLSTLVKRWQPRHRSTQRRGLSALQRQRLRHSRESLSWLPATVDQIAARHSLLLERGKPVAERACCTVTVLVGTDASGAAAAKAATPAAPRNQTCGPMV